MSRAKHLVCLVLCLVMTHVVVAQKKYTISGYIKDGASTESLIAATVYDKASSSGTTSNNFGFYSITLNAGFVDMTYSYVGYTPQQLSFMLQQDTTINVELSGGMVLNEAVVTGRTVEQIQNRTQMSSVNIPVPQLKSLPMFLGEVDLLKVLQLMPGIQSGGEGTSGLYVRGGGPDQNLILLDGVPVYNASHLFGFFSVFNTDAINNVELLKGGFPARYGGRTSSVVDIQMKEGNNQEFHGEGAIGLISARLTLEGPIRKDKTSFIVSGRRTYADLFTQPIINKINEGNDNKVTTGYYFYDLTAKVNHRFSNKDRLFLSAYMGSDKFHLEDTYQSRYNTNSGYTSKSGINWGNITSALRWNHIFTNRLFGNSTLTYSRFRFNTIHSFNERYNQQSEFYEMDYYSSIEDLSAQIAFDYHPSPNHYIRFGASSIRHAFKPGVSGISQRASSQERTNSIDTIIGAPHVSAYEWGVYAEDDFRVTDRLKVNAGVHWSGFAVRSNFYSYLQPRLSARYLVGWESAVKASYSRMVQYVHLLTNSGISLPTDLWVPTTDQLKPQISDQIAWGISKNFRQKYEVSIEAYYKKMNRVLEYKEGASYFDLDGSWENKVLQGEGESYGLEVFGEKKTGKLTGWIGYTLSWTNRTFELLNNGKTFPYKYDRRHDVSIVSIYRPSSKIELSGTWVFGSGNAITIPTASFRAQNPFIPQGSPINSKVYGGRNEYRMDSYHRLDLSISFIRQVRWGESRWSFGVYNTYCRRNPYYIDVVTTEQYNPTSGKTEQKSEFTQYSLFPIIPSISYHFKF